MITMLLDGRDRELTLIARDWLAEHPEHRTATNSPPPPVWLVA